jgi:hypothetical protein
VRGKRQNSASYLSVALGRVRIVVAIRTISSSLHGKTGREAYRTTVREAGSSELAAAAGVGLERTRSGNRAKAGRAEISRTTDGIGHRYSAETDRCSRGVARSSRYAAGPCGIRGAGQSGQSEQHGRRKKKLLHHGTPSLVDRLSLAVVVICASSVR